MSEYWNYMAILIFWISPVEGKRKGQRDRGRNQLDMREWAKLEGKDLRFAGALVVLELLGSVLGVKRHLMLLRLLLRLFRNDVVVNISQILRPSTSFNKVTTHHHLS